MLPPVITYKDNLYYSASEMNELVHKHNRIVETLLTEWARMIGVLNFQIALLREKGEDYDDLMECYNQLLHETQLTKMLQDENQFLWEINLDLHKIIEEIKNDR